MPLAPCHSSCSSLPSSPALPTSAPKPFPWTASTTAPPLPTRGNNRPFLRQVQAAGVFGMRVEEDKVKGSTAVMFFFTLAETETTQKLPLITIPAQ